MSARSTGGFILGLGVGAAACAAAVSMVGLAQPERPPNRPVRVIPRTVQPGQLFVTQSADGTAAYLWSANRRDGTITYLGTATAQEGDQSPADAEDDGQ